MSLRRTAPAKLSKLGITIFWKAKVINIIDRIQAYTYIVRLLYGNYFLHTAFVGREVELTNGCVIGASCKLTEPETIPENTMVYGSQCQRREMYDKPYVSAKSLHVLLGIF